MDETPTKPERVPDNERPTFLGVGALWRVWLLPLGLLVLVMFVFGLGKAGLIAQPDRWIEQAGLLAGSPWGLPALIALFCIGAFIGFPQFLLYASAIVAFDNVWTGIGYAWLAMLCSGAVTFWTGRLGGEAFFDRFAGLRAQKVSKFLGTNAFKASALVRLVPAGPFLIVNMAFGVSKARFLPFMGGMALGALPKLGVVALIGQGVTTLREGSFVLGALAVLSAVIIWGWLATVRR